MPNYFDKNLLTAPYGASRDVLLGTLITSDWTEMENLEKLLEQAREASSHPNPQLAPVFEYLQCKTIAELEAIIERRKAESSK